MVSLAPARSTAEHNALWKTFSRYRCQQSADASTATTTGAFISSEAH
eukprot:CAMPEP_0185191016 /NCGR_PEP_ID=MMETSP1140-20130426/13342_1 /TAXON_ID=298111 /ORGANISM="Pavlova sp., Strain CCMP459" /LENGTH=46 /DNA_ID= /DNA_START= /DNA_END= /DNA_ORIENTATION=